MTTGFGAIQATTLCPYAATARVAYGPPWSEDMAVSENWDRVAEHLAEWVQTAEANRSHGYALEIADPGAASFERVRELLREALEHLNRRDPASSPCMKGPFCDPEWQFEFNGLRMFVNVFAPCYPLGHSKHSDAEDRVYLFLQPEYSFDLCGVNPGNVSARTFVRERFKKAGSAYNGDLIDQRLEAYLYMFPLSPSDPPVKWWEST